MPTGELFDWMILCDAKEGCEHSMIEKSRFKKW